MEGNVVWRSRVRLVDEVAAELRERIYAGAYAPGAKLRQEELAEDLQVSRTPLREALRVLESEGLVVNEPGRGVRVVMADLPRFLAAYRLREVVDGLAARLAAESDDADARAGISALIEHQERALEPWDPREYTRTNVDFHTRIMEIGGNEYVLAEAPIVRMTSQVFTPIAFLHFEAARTAVDQHRGIAAAIADGEGDAAERLARAHIRTTIERMAGHDARAGRDTGTGRGDGTGHDPDKAEAHG
ncbi:MAG TPA: GntR family transcriptional regulator [Solirubrobacteraceae bacterium]|nr:GntR family transcriptional regulator [Solirubrobacteraceae bacterium]